MAEHVLGSNPHFQKLGGEEGVRSLVDRFYARIDENPAYGDIRKLHPADLTDSANKLFWFLTEWTGGAKHFSAKIGPPALRRRHMSFPIGIRERDQWMACMQQAMKDVGLEAALQEELIQALAKTADFLRNRNEPL